MRGKVGMETMESRLEHKPEETQKIQIRLPEKVKQVMDRLEAHGYEAYAVGGCIRDSLQSRRAAVFPVSSVHILP